MKLKKYIHINYSAIEISTHNNQICHFYKKIPNIIPDFIYLDGPSPLNVKGNINNIDFSKHSVMSADILKLESILQPGCVILVDGRSNNARFLKNNFKRKFQYYNGCENLLKIDKNINFIE